MGRTTAAGAAHTGAAARIDVAGFDLVAVHASLAVDHEALRTSAGLIDHGASGIIDVTGQGAVGCIQRAVTRDVEFMFADRCLSALVLTDAGSVVDVVTVFRTSDGYRILTSAGRGPTVRDHLVALGCPDVTVLDRSQKMTTIGVEGPAAWQAVGATVGPDAEALPFRGVTAVAWGGTEVSLSRMGFTGEYGYLFVLPADRAAALWDELAGRATPAGLDALETAMIEMRQPVVRLEIDDDTSVVAAGLNWLVDRDAGDFLGRSAVETAAADEPLRTVGVASPRALEAGTDLTIDGEPVGRVLVSRFSPSRDTHLGLARINRGWAASGITLEAGDADTTLVHTISSPYVTPQSWSGPIL